MSDCKLHGRVLVVGVDALVHGQELRDVFLLDPVAAGAEVLDRPEDEYHDADRGGDDAARPPEPRRGSLEARARQENHRRGESDLQHGNRRTRDESLHRSRVLGEEIGDQQELSRPEERGMNDPVEERKGEEPEPQHR